MRIVREEGAFSAAFDMSRSEAASAFGDNRVFVEKYIESPRHIEFQVLGDSHGNIVHLFERECSIQRRLQKVVEEAPSSVLDPELRERMGKAAVEAARSCGYAGAGTVEFLLDANHDFYFMEMNTRLQVEHPVTEWITGIDLVIEQIRVAEGHPLRWNQDEISMNGHAIECRVYAEDADADFMPAPGHLAHHRAPAGFGVRVDAGVEGGDDISIHYDPMISKLITWGRSRKEAIRRMERALAEYEIAGVPTTIGFCRFVMGHEAFRSGNFSTHFVNDYWNADAASDSDPEREGASVDPALREALAHLSAHLYREDGASTPSNNGNAGPNGNGFGTDQWSSEWRRRRNGRAGK